jgi:hypothetical protein
MRTEKGARGFCIALGNGAFIVAGFPVWPLETLSQGYDVENHDRSGHLREQPALSSCITPTT